MTVCPSRGFRHDHVTLDLDHKRTPPRSLVLPAWVVVKKAWWRKSASKNGVHVILCLWPRLSMPLKMMVRLQNLDDIARVTGDLYRIHFSRGQWDKYAIGSLWDSKGGRDAGEWRPFQPKRA